MNEIPFGITKEDVLDLAAKRMVDEFGDNSELGERAEKQLRERIEEVVNRSVVDRINEVLTAELEKIMAATYTPVDMFGNSTGKPTTIRTCLLEQAKMFWSTHVDSEGKHTSSYGGSPRSEHLMRKLLANEFEKSVKENATVIVAEFKKALVADSTKMVTQHINNLIK